MIKVTLGWTPYLNLKRGGKGGGEWDAVRLLNPLILVFVVLAFLCSGPTWWGIEVPFRGKDILYECTIVAALDVFVVSKTAGASA